MILEAGQIIDAKYRVVRRIGEGGMGTVYEGENSRIGRRVAIKVLHAQVASMPEFVERFEREARAAARIGSPHVCDVLDLGDLPNGDRYIVMEFLDGVSLEDRIVERGKMTCAQLAPIAFELLEGLGTMHVARVIHRDLKPANVFLARTPGGRGEVVKILDFGVAKLLPFGGEVGTMTQTGTMMGTPLYMSPEQARGARDVDGRTDIYAASVMFYRALAGVLPYNADSLNELLFKIVLEDPKPLRDVAPDVDEVFAEIVHKGLARDINQRYATAREYQEAIARWGKTQGRSSLSFAVTLPSVRPEPPSKDSDPPRPVAAALTAANGGTPIAWTEDAGSNPRLAARPNPPAYAPGLSARAAATVGLPASAPTPSSPTPGSGTGASLSDPLGGSTLASSGVAPAALSAAEPVVANATTMPTASTNEVTPKAAKPAATDKAAAAAPAALGRSSGAASKRGLIAGIVGAGALAVVAIIAFGRGGAAGPTAGTAPATAASASADLSARAAGTAVPKESTSAAGDAAVAIAATPSAPEAASSTPATPAGPTATATARRTVTTQATTAATAATVVAAATAPATATAQPTPSAKPAASARKFRTNLD